jgi:Putative zinc-finger
MTEHMEVASYVLGLLEPAEMSRFEEHLAGCDECAMQLESLLPMVSQLADVEPGDLFNVTGPSAFGPPAQSAAPRPMVTPAPLVPQEPPVRRAELRSAEFPGQDRPSREYSSQGRQSRQGQEYPDQEYPDQGYPDQEYPNQGYPGQEYPGRGRPTPDYPTPNPKYPDPDPEYPNPEYQDPDYPDYLEPAAGLLPMEPTKRSPRGRSGSRPPAVDRFQAGRASTGEQRTIEPTGERMKPTRRIALSRPGGAARPEVTRPARPARSPGAQNRGLLIASAAAIIGVLAGGGVVAVGPWSQSEAPKTATAISPASATDRLTATDPKTGVHTDVVLESKAWGTLVSFGVTDVDGPRNCRLVAVRTDGESEILSSWTVPKQGYGTATAPQELTLEAATSLRKEDIAALRIQQVGKNGGGTNLVTVNT